MMERKKLGVAIATVALCGALGGAMALAGCATPTAATGEGSDVSSAEASEKPASEMTMQDWGKQFPLQYNSYHKLDWWSESYTRANQPHGHFAMLAREAGPLMSAEKENFRGEATFVESMPDFTEDGRFGVESLDYDSDTGQWVVDDSKWVETITSTSQGYKVGCYACRSSKFNEAYEKYGAEAFGKPVDEEFADMLNGQMWDCAVCHGDNPNEKPDATLEYWKQLARESFDDFDPLDRACGQCHTGLDHRSRITDQSAMDSFDPYKYGMDIDGLYDAYVEDGIYSTEEETGVKVVYIENQLEFTADSTHSNLGITCVNCHMPKVVDSESGEVYTDHDASGSPLEKAESLEYCLTCHKAQGIESADDMVAMVREKQDEAESATRDAWEKRDMAHQALADAVKGGSFDESVLAAMQDKYGRARLRLYTLGYGNTGQVGSRVVHNPDRYFLYIEQANAMFDEVISALS